MQSLTGQEPHLELGDTGEWVLQLQVRLYLLGIYQDWPDSTYNSATQSAVRELQSMRGLSNDGEVTQECWEAILYLEQQAAIDYYWHSPYDALAQIRYDLEHPVDHTGALSEDGQWRWDGSAWQPAQHAQPADGGAGGAGQNWVGHVSEDGRYRWDGSAWEAVGSAGASGGSARTGQDWVGHLSEDGHWRWDGHEWQAA